MTQSRSFSREYIACVRHAWRQLDEGAMPPSAQAHDVMSRLRLDLISLCSTKARAIVEELAEAASTTRHRAVHFGFAQEGLLAMTNTASIYFDEFIFQEYLSRTLPEPTAPTDANRAAHVIGSMASILELEGLVNSGIAHITPNAAFAQFDLGSPEIHVETLRPVAQYILPTTQLAAAIGAIPYTTWPTLDAGLFARLRRDLAALPGVGQLGASTMLDSGLMADVLGDLSRTSDVFPYLKEVEVRDVLAVRRELTLFRDALHQFCVRERKVAIEQDEDDLQAAVAMALEQSLQASKALLAGLKRRQLLTWASGTFLGILGLSPYAFINYAATGSSFAKDTVQLWNDLEVHKRTDGLAASTIFQAFHLMNERGRRRGG